MFKNVPQYLPVARYHSLICSSVPKDFIINSSCHQMIMSVRHKTERVCGLQCHPESILTPSGDRILKQIIHWASLKYATKIQKISYS